MRSRDLRCSRAFMFQAPVHVWVFQLLECSGINMSICCLVFCWHTPALSVRNVNIITGQSRGWEELLAKWVISEYNSHHVHKTRIKVKESTWQNIYILWNTIRTPSSPSYTYLERFRIENVILNLFREGVFLTGIILIYTVGDVFLIWDSFSVTCRIVPFSVRVLFFSCQKLPGDP